MIAQPLGLDGADRYHVLICLLESVAATYCRHCPALLGLRTVLRAQQSAGPLATLAMNHVTLTVTNAKPPGVLPTAVRPSDRGHSGADSHSAPRRRPPVYRSQRTADGHAGHRSRLSDDRPVRGRPGDEAPGRLRRACRRSRAAAGGLGGGPLRARVRMRGENAGGAKEGTPEIYLATPTGSRSSSRTPATAADPASWERSARRRRPVASRRW